ncbi:MAG: hypothetical protein IPK58_24900 [Acidobacteria bacterium]|nr:hypothetical protein [Acidobacteriota bacterium]
MAHFFFISILLIGSVAGCRRAEIDSPKQNFVPIGGPVFPAAEVCSYPNGSVLERHGSFNQRWEKDESVQNNSNIVYGCEPTGRTVAILNRHKEQNDKDRIFRAGAKQSVHIESVLIIVFVVNRNFQAA